MDRFVPRDDAKRQWEQSPERTNLLHPDMKCRVFILKTGGFLTAAAIDARWRICLRRHDMAAGFHHRHDLASANATKKFRAGTLLR